MLNWILRILGIAQKINMRRSTIFLVIELLRQFNRSLAKSDIQAKTKRVGKEGFVYVIRNRTRGERFKIGHRASPPWRDGQLRSGKGESGDFVLILPAKDASALEKRLRQAYAKHHKKSDWFTLSDGERRELLIIAALVQVFANDELGMAVIDQEIVQVATDLLNKLQALATALVNKRRRKRQPDDNGVDPSETEPNLEDFSAIPDFDWNWENVLKKDYHALPKLTGKEAYVTFIRDNSARQGKVYFDNHPNNSIKAAFLERSLRFPLEVVMVLKVDNKKKARARFRSPFESKNSTQWINLSDEELGEVIKVAREDWKHGTVYITPKSHWGLETLPCDAFQNYPELKEPVGYICVVQGVQPGMRRKIWETLHPKRLAGDLRLALMLNNPHDVHTTSEPIRFRCIIKAEQAESFQSFLHKRYATQETGGGWFELEDVHLKEIYDMGK